MHAPASGSPLERLPLRAPGGNYHAVIEATAGSRNKCKFDPRLGVLVLHKVLPLGLSFPFSFGFLPATLGDDGDPLDVLVLMDEPVPPGTVVPCRLIGVIEARQRKGRAPAFRNDRLLAVAHESEDYARCRAPGDLGRELLAQIERFFAGYQAQRGQRFEPLARRGRTRAEALVERGRRRHDAQCGARG